MEYLVLTLIKGQKNNFTLNSVKKFESLCISNTQTPSCELQPEERWASLRKTLYCYCRKPSIWGQQIGVRKAANIALALPQVILLDPADNADFSDGYK